MGGTYADHGTPSLWDFDFDPQTGELRREGNAVRLQTQPSQVLGVLLSHAGDVVTRETLRAVVWGSGTFVDFDRG